MNGRKRGFDNKLKKQKERPESRWSKTCKQSDKPTLKSRSSCRLGTKNRLKRQLGSDFTLRWKRKK